MDEVRVIEIKKSVFADNDEDAGKLRKELKDRGVYLLNLMSAPGSGKTTTLIGTLQRISPHVPGPYGCLAGLGACPEPLP